jgi:cytochrome c-type biogenesis protein CcmH/NrfF
MSPLWLIPGLVLLIGSAAIVALLRSTAEEAKLLAEEIGRQREVGESIRRLGEALRALRGPAWPRR